MRGNLSFLASDALEGRLTPSQGLTFAAEFIASRFRRAGLEPAAPNYFQTADQVTVTPKLDDFRMTLAAGGEELELSSADAIVRSLQGLDATKVPVIATETGLPDRQTQNSRDDPDRGERKSSEG